MFVISALLPYAASAFAPTLLYLWQAQNSTEANGANWWFWLLLLLLLIVLIWWLLRREMSGTVTEERGKSLPPVHAHSVAPHSAEPVAPVAAVSSAAVAEPAPPLVTASGLVDNLTRIEGIGPKINELLHNASINTFADLAQTEVGQLRTVLLQAGLKIHDPTTWPEQAALAAAGKWTELQALQEQLDGGRRRA